MIDSKRIIKNTIFLYIRLFLILFVTLYTSRVVLDKLGVDDFGLYNVVYGVIGILSFLTGTLSIGTSRFITYELGSGNIERLKSTFRTSLTTHILLSAIIFIIGETIGLWYVNNVMVCPPERLFAANIVFQISIITSIISVMLIPFTAEIIAHEKMDVYAYIGIIEAFAGLTVVLLLSITSFDRLVFYAVLVLLVKIIVFSLYVIYTRRKFEEVSFKLGLQTGIFKSLLSFSGLNIIANISNTLMNQGVVMLFNFFFTPVVVAAQAISNQISQALQLFVGNVRQAINPQVIKLYADNQLEESKRLTLSSAEYVFDLLLLFGIPLILIMPTLLNIWLVDVPEYTVAFARFIVLQTIFDNFNAAFYTPMVAANKIKINSFFAAITCIVQFGLLTILFKCGMGPIWTYYVGLSFVLVWSFLIKPLILWKEVGYSLKELYNCISHCLIVFGFVLLSAYLVYHIIPQNTLFDSFLVLILSLVIVLAISFLFMKKNTKKRITSYIKNKLGFIR